MPRWLSGVLFFIGMCLGTFLAGLMVGFAEPEGSWEAWRIGLFATGIFGFPTGLLVGLLIAIE